MNFGSPTYLAFIVLVVIAIHLVVGKKARDWLLVGASIIFYGFWDPRFIPLLLIISVMSWCLGALVDRPPSTVRAWIMGLGIATLMAPLMLFKYTNFLVANLGALGSGVGTGPVLDVILPVGISFFTFQAVGYVCDVASGRLKPEASLARYTAYMTFFPHLAAGPIVRAADFLPQLAAEWHAPSARVVSYSLARFAWGLFKKICIADHLAASIVDPVFNNLDQATGPTIVLATFAFSLQIYADFSGYSDIAISSARLLGFRLRENFDAPYLATSPRDFWRRWHISLSQLIRDYVYIPMGGSRRVGTVRASVNAFVSMLLCGFWHGAAWNFVFWGALHGVALVGARALPKAGSKVAGLLLGWMMTQALVLLGWFVFRVNSLGDMAVAGERLLAGGWKPTDLSPSFLAILLLDGMIIFGEQAIIKIWRSDRVASKVRRRLVDPPVQIGFAFVTVCALIVLANPNGAASPFLYFQF